MRVMIAVTHLLGTGHLSRSLTLAAAFRDAGHTAVVVSGGMPVPHLSADGIEIVQLPPLRSDGTDFTRLLGADGTLAGPDYLSTRADALVATLRDTRPDVLICELFPFGRRILAAEFLALLEAARAVKPRPLVLCSIRDILAPPSKPAKADRADAIVAAYFDAVLVHSDPATTPLETSWPVSPRLSQALRYTGYVAPPVAGPHPADAGTGEVLVTAGGGPVGDSLYGAAVGAARLDPGRTWRLLIGGDDKAARIAALRELTPGNVVLEPARPDFRQMLYHAAASVSMCGYNTALDLLQAGTPAVLVPFDDGNEVEQNLRARSLAALPGFKVLRSADLTSARLVQAVADVMADAPRPASEAPDGAAETVRIAERMVRA